MLLRLGVSGIIALGAASAAFAGTFTQSPDPAAVVRGSSGGTNVDFSFAGNGATQEAQLDLRFDSTGLTITAQALVGGSTCGFDVSTPANTLIRIAPPSGAGTALTSTATAYCRFNVVAAAGATVGARAFTVATAECTPAGPGGTCAFTGQGLNIADAPPAAPPVLTFNPASGTIASGGTFTITPSGGETGGSATYSCTTTPAAGYTLTNGSGTINQGGAAVTVTAACDAGNFTDGAISCTHTGGAGGTASPVAYTLDCPVAPVPPTVAPSNVTAGSNITIGGGSAGATGNGTLTFSASGGAGSGAAAQTVVACSSTNAAVTVSPASRTFEGATTTNQSFTVSLGLTAASQTFPDGTISCSVTPAGGAATTVTFGVAAPAGTTFVAPAVIPASSLWSQLALIAVFLGLGGLVLVGRRNG